MDMLRREDMGKLDRFVEDLVTLAAQLMAGFFVVMGVILVVVVFGGLLFK